VRGRPVAFKEAGGAQDEGHHADGGHVAGAESLLAHEAEETAAFHHCSNPGSAGHEEHVEGRRVVDRSIGQEPPVTL